MYKAHKIFEPIWQDYQNQNPLVRKIYELFIDLGEEVVNDHIAFRTFNDPRVNIDVLAQQFVDAGYEFKGDYHFKQKKLYAKHFELTGFNDAPRVFISELKLEEMSQFLRETVLGLIDQIPSELLYSPHLILKGRVWDKPYYATYEKLRQESEYASWLYVFGFRANHFTVNINALKQLDSMNKVIGFLEKNNFKMNTSGGVIKGSPTSLLEQSSVVAGTIPVEFNEGTFDIPSCYYEFAKRYKDKNGKLYPGFIAKSADSIFESTNYRKN